MLQFKHFSSMFQTSQNIQKIVQESAKIKI